MFSRLRSLFSPRRRAAAATLRDWESLVDKEAVQDYFERTPQSNWPIRVVPDDTVPAGEARFVFEEPRKQAIAKPQLTKKPGAKKRAPARKKTVAPKSGSTKPKAKKSTAAKKTASKRAAPRASTKKTTRAKPRRKS
jgi:hypothetical protein